MTDIIFGATQIAPDVASFDRDISKAAEAWLVEVGKHSDPRYKDLAVWDRLCNAVYRKWEACGREP